MDRSPSVSFEPNQPLLFEVAWEAGRKVGGIYTVLRSKAPKTVRDYGDRYCLIGPYDPVSAATEFESIPISGLYAPAVDAISRQGMRCYYGRWLIPGYPRVLLMDLGSVREKQEHINKMLWDECQIGTSFGDKEMDDAALFGYIVLAFLQEMLGCTGDRPILAQFHEWMAAAALPLMRARRMRIATIFTTHATLLGRYICAGDVDFYNQLTTLDPDKEASNRGIFHRFYLERAAAAACHIFSTVSEVTAEEAKYLLHRDPEAILPNGLATDDSVLLHEFQTFHQKYKERIQEFVRGHFFGNYDFNMDKTLFFFTAGRYEYRNKGVDLFIDSLATLNGRLKAENSDVTIIAFIVMPGKQSGFNADSLSNQFSNKDLEKTCNQVMERVGRRIYESCARGQLPDPNDLMTKEEIIMLKRRTVKVATSQLPPIVTHNMPDSDSDAIITHLRRVELFNRPQDRVKVVFHPEFLQSTNPLFGLEYEDFVRGCHLGVFGSYYEPWGYTPAECAVKGVPSLCTNLSGYGNFIQRHVENPESRGCFIVDRKAASYHDSVHQAAEYMHRFVGLDRRQRILLRNRTERLSEILSWDKLGQAYDTARELALERLKADPECRGDVQSMRRVLSNLKVARSESHFDFRRLSIGCPDYDSEDGWTPRSPNT